MVILYINFHLIINCQFVLSKLSNLVENTNKHQINVTKNLRSFIKRGNNRNIEDRYTKRGKIKNGRKRIKDKHGEKCQKLFDLKDTNLIRFPGKHRQIMTILPKKVTSMVVDTEGKYVRVLSPRNWHKLIEELILKK